MKLNFDKIFNGVLFVVVIFLLIQKAPIIYQNFSFQGQKAGTLNYQDLSGNKLQLPIDKNRVIVFWATWCGPCKIELARINSLIKSHPEYKEAILAVSSFENSATVREEVQKQNYEFPVGVDPEGTLSKQFNISGTPTILFINKDQKMEWVTTGLSPSLELRIKNFLTK